MRITTRLVNENKGIDTRSAYPKVLMAQPQDQMPEKIIPGKRNAPEVKSGPIKMNDADRIDVTHTGN